MRAPSEANLRLIFRLAVTPAARLLRALGVDRLGLKRRPTASTYWKRRTGSAARIDMTSKS
jgi:hypothetical protein